jgi:transposase-like protein
MGADLQNPIFTNEDKAREALEAIRWPNGPICPHCGSVERLAKVEGTKHSHRPGLWYCNECKGQFTVTVGTVFERSKIPLSKWWLATYLLASSKKGMSSHQLHRTLGVTYKTAWFMTHRIREAMTLDGSAGPIGGEGKTIEADETYYGSKENRRNMQGRKRQGPGGKSKVVALVERGGAVRSFHVENIDAKTIGDILTRHAAKGSGLVSDEANAYKSIGSWARGHFASHGTVMHSANEYVRGDAHTNTIEGVFSIFKRGMVGVYQHYGEQHLQRYLTEFDFRYSNRAALGVSDKQRTAKAMKGIGGKRLTYRRTHKRPEAQTPPQ